MALLRRRRRARRGRPAQLFGVPRTVGHPGACRGKQNIRTETILRSAGLQTGSVYYTSTDRAPAEERVKATLRRLGYPEAQVRISTYAPSQDRVVVSIRVDEGPANLLEHVRFVGDLDPLPFHREQRRLLRWAAREGVREGEPLEPEAIGAAQYAIRERLASMRRVLFRPRFGWTSARVAPAVVRTEQGAVRLTYTIELGPRVHLEVEGLLWGERKARTALGIDERLRLTRGFLEEAPRTMEQWLQKRGSSLKNIWWHSICFGREN